MTALAAPKDYTRMLDTPFPLTDEWQFALAHVFEEDVVQFARREAQGEFRTRLLALRIKRLLMNTRDKQRRQTQVIRTQTRYDKNKQ